MSEMQFTPEEFDAWAGTYDDNTRIDAFPFTGYSRVLETIFAEAHAQPGMKVLDLGCGTGLLTQRFAEAGCHVWGIDFSAPMLELARERLGTVPLLLADVRAEWPADFEQRYDRIVSGYTFHHFSQPGKIALMRKLIESNLRPGGRIVIGDVAFDSAAAQARFAASMGSEWEPEYYWDAAEDVTALASAGIKVAWQRVSDCAGVFTFRAD